MTFIRHPWQQLLLVLVFFLYRPPVGIAAVSSKNKATAAIVSDTAGPNCSKSALVEKIINDAISIGAPVYNSGYHLACYRIYEWAGYKILYEYGDSCAGVKKIIKAGIDKSHGDFSDLEKAWIMRAAFDKVMGVPTQTADPAKKTETDRKG